MKEPEDTSRLINQPSDSRVEDNEQAASLPAHFVEDMTGAVAARDSVTSQPGVATGRLGLLLLNIVLLLACVTLTALNRFAPVKRHGVRNTPSTVTVSTATPTQTGGEGASDLGSQPTPGHTVVPSATVGHSATYAASTPTPLPPTATPSPVALPTPVASPTASPTACVTCG